MIDIEAVKKDIVERLKPLDPGKRSCAIRKMS